MSEADIREFLEAQLAEDQKIAEDANALDTDWPFWVEADDAAELEAADAFRRRHGPARVLRDVEATRRLAALHTPDVDGDCSTCCRPSELEVLWDSDEETVTEARRPWSSPCPSLLLLALPYADHPGYDPSWSPESVTGDS